MKFIDKVVKGLIRVVEYHPKLNMLAYELSIGLKLPILHDPDFAGMKSLRAEINGGDVLDIGANIGHFIQDMRKLGFTNRILAFEPQRYCFKRLKKLEGEDTIVYNFGLGQSGTHEMYHATYKGTKIHTLFTTDKDRLQDAIEEMYPTLSVDTEMEVVRKKSINEIGGPVNPSLIKIDTEGDELEILRDILPLVLETNPIMIIENNEDFDAIRDLIADRYVCCYFGSRFIEVGKRDPQYRNFYCLPRSIRDLETLVENWGRVPMP